MSTLTSIPNSVQAPPASNAAEAALVDRWGRYVRGEEVPPAIAVPSEVEEMIAAREREKGLKFTDSAKWLLRRAEMLARLHPGQTVIWLDTPAGPAVIAAGDEVMLFYKHYLDALSRDAHVEYPCPFTEPGE